eukprot:scpid68853/ scgid29242/ 
MGTAVDWPESGPQPLESRGQFYQICTLECKYSMTLARRRKLNPPAATCKCTQWSNMLRHDSSDDRPDGCNVCCVGQHAFSHIADAGHRGIPLLTTTLVFTLVYVDWI